MTTTTDETAGASTAEVRAWAERRHLLEPGGRGRLSAEIHAAYANELAAVASAAAEPEPEPGVVPSAVIGARELPAEPADRETPPQRTKERASDRARRFWKRDDAGPDKRRRRTHKRVSLETLGGLAWTGGARLVAFAGEQYLPVVKMMSFQAPVAGAVVEDLAKGTVADRIMQPVARLTESGGAVGALVGAPLLTAVVCRQPSLYPQVRPMLLAAMREWVIVAGPKLREMKRREEKFAEEMGEFTAEFGVTIDMLLDEVFGDLLAAANGQAPGPAADANGSAG